LSCKGTVKSNDKKCGIVTVSTLTKTVDSAHNDEFLELKQNIIRRTESQKNAPKNITERGVRTRMPASNFKFTDSSDIPMPLNVTVKKGFIRKRVPKILQQKNIDDITMKRDAAAEEMKKKYEQHQQQRAPMPMPTLTQKETVLPVANRKGRSLATSQISQPQNYTVKPRIPEPQTHNDSERSEAEDGRGDRSEAEDDRDDNQLLPQQNSMSMLKKVSEVMHTESAQKKTVSTYGNDEKVKLGNRTAMRVKQQKDQTCDVDINNPTRPVIVTAKGKDSIKSTSEKSVSNFSSDYGDGRAKNKTVANYDSHFPPELCGEKSAKEATQVTVLSTKKPSATPGNFGIVKKGVAVKKPIFSAVHDTSSFYIPKDEGKSLVERYTDSKHVPQNVASNTKSTNPFAKNVDPPAPVNSQCKPANPFSGVDPYEQTEKLDADNGKDNDVDHVPKIIVAPKGQKRVELIFKRVGKKNK
jgi:hypothetical protein